MKKHPLDLIRRLVITNDGLRFSNKKIRICDLEEDKIKKGLRVWNYKKTQQGTIVDLDPDTREGLMVYIKWDDNQESSWWAFDLKCEIASNQ